MQGHQPVHHGDHIRFALSFFPHLIRLQEFFYQAWRDHFLQQSQIDLVANLVLQPVFRSANDHEAGPFVQIFDDGLSMPSGLPLCLLFFLFSHPFMMRYSYLNSIAIRLMSHIAKHFGQNLDLATLFQHPTVAELAVI